MTALLLSVPADGRRRRLAFFYGCAVVLLAGLVLSLGVFTIRGAADSDPLQYLLCRAVGFTAAMTIAAWWRDNRSPLTQVRHLSLFGWISAAAMTATQMTFVSAAKMAPFAEVFLLSSLSPLMAASLAGPLLGERMGWLGGAAIAMGLAGIWAMTGGSGLPASGLGLSSVLAVSSALGFALYSLATRGSKAEDRDAALIVVGLATFVVAAVLLRARGLPLMPSPMDAGLAVLHGSLFLAAGLFLFGQGSRYIPGVTFTMLAQGEAIFSPAWGYVFFGETPSIGVLAGGALILVAVLLQSIDGARQMQKV